MAQLEIERHGFGPVPLAAVIDTGFTAWLALPPEAIERLGLTFKGKGTIRFGNQARQSLSVYRARVKFCGQWITIDVHEIPGDPTIGMELLRGHRLEFDALPGAEVEIEPVG